MGERGGGAFRKAKKGGPPKDKSDKKARGAKGQRPMATVGRGSGGVVGGPPGWAGHAGGRAATELEIYHERAPRPGQ